MHRFYNPELDNGTLGEAESKHATQVLRLAKGDRITVFNGRGKEALATILEDKTKKVSYRIVSSQATPRMAPQIHLGQAIPKGKVMDLIIQKTTELGVASISPILSDRSVPHYKDDKEELKREKWQQTAIEACKQSGQNWLPEIQPPSTLSHTLSQIPKASVLLIASLQPEAIPLHQIMKEARDSKPASVYFLIGPEGDYTPAEIGLARAAGFHPVSLGPNILRTETAALFTMSILSYELTRG